MKNRFYIGFIRLLLFLKQFFNRLVKNSKDSQSLAQIQLPKYSIDNKTIKNDFFLQISIINC